MFEYDTVIDTIQNGKKEFVKMTVKNDKIAQALNEFVDAQTEYTKNAVDASIGTVKAISSEMAAVVQQPAKFDYYKMFDSVNKTLKAFIPAYK